MADGGVYGYPVVDVGVTVTDGKEHSVDSSEMAFKVAGRLAFRAALAAGRAGHPRAGQPPRGRRARSTVQGDVMGDLNARRGRVQGTDTTARRPPGGDGAGAHVRDPALRHRAAVADRRPRPVPRPARPLRRPPVAPRRRGAARGGRREPEGADGALRRVRLRSGRRAARRPADGGAQLRPPLPGAPDAGPSRRGPRRDRAPLPRSRRVVGARVRAARDRHLRGLRRPGAVRARGPRARRGRDRLGGPRGRRRRRRSTAPRWPSSSPTRPTRSPPRSTR